MEVCTRLRYSEHGFCWREPPARYVASWRMHLASRCSPVNGSQSEIAARLGYDSEPAVSPAFKRIVGKPPSGLRRSA